MTKKRESQSAFPIICQAHRCPLVLGEMRTFALVRNEDISGKSGTGIVAQGVEWHDKTVTLKWLRPPYGEDSYHDLQSLLSVHEHGGKAEVVFHHVDMNLERKRRGKRK